MQNDMRRKTRGGRKALLLHTIEKIEVGKHKCFDPNKYSLSYFRTLCGTLNTQAGYTKYSVHNDRIRDMIRVTHNAD